MFILLGATLEIREGRALPSGELRGTGVYGLLSSNSNTHHHHPQLGTHVRAKRKREEMSNVITAQKRAAAARAAKKEAREAKEAKEAAAH